MNRREFLRQTAGAAAAWAVPLDRADAAKRVVIVGAGLAGLSAGYELTKAGHDVTILEARARPGGRVHTLRDPFAEGQHAEAGATRIPAHHEFTLRYAGLFGLTLQPFEPRDAASVYFLRGRRLRSVPGGDVDWPYDLTPEEKKLGVAGIREKYIWSVSDQLGDPTDPKWPPPGMLEKYDAMTRSDFLVSRGASPGAVALLSALAGAGDRASARSALFMLRNQGLNGRARQYHKIVGGNDLLPKAFASRLAEKIRYASPVERIEHDPRGVRAVYAHAGSYHTLGGDYLICAVPFSVQRRIEVVPPFSVEKRSAIEHLPYLSDSKIFLQSRRRFWAAAGESGFATADLSIGQVWDMTYGQAGTRGILMARAIGVPSQRLTAMSEGERIVRALEDVERIYPGARDHYEGGVSKCWDEDEWARGATAYYAPGQMSTLWPHVSRPEGRVHFAGEHTSVWVDGWMQGALESGNRAAKEVHEARNRGG